MLTVLIDGNNIAIRTLLVIPGYNAQFQSPHQLNFFIHSFLNSFLIICNKIKQKYNQPINIVIIWDSKINNRKKLYPNYKANRKPRTEEEEKDKNNHYSLLNELKENLQQLGDWFNTSLIGYEADDLIAYFTKLPDYTNNFIIVSSDNDFFQLLGNRIIQYLPHKKESYTILDFQKEFDIIPEKYVYVKALAGDRGDNIVGINGIGIKKAVKLIQQGQCWAHWLNTYGKEVDLEMNVELIRIPFESDKINLKLPQSYFDKKAWIEIFQKYSLNKLNLSDFRQLLSNETKKNNKLV